MVTKAAKEQNHPNPCREKETFMNMFEKAEAIKSMIEMCKLTQSDMAKKLGVSQSYVANKLRLLQLDKPLREKILSASLTERHARALLRIRSLPKRKEALEKITERNLTVSESEALADYIHADELPREILRAPRGERISSFNSALSECLTVLKSVGVDANKTVGYHGTKTYITIAIDEA